MIGTYWRRVFVCLACSFVTVGRVWFASFDLLVDFPVVSGAMEGHRLADVVEGEITCEEAMGVLDEYGSRKDVEGVSKAREVGFDGWNCSSPTAGVSGQLQAKTVCEHPVRGIAVHAPL